jgi:hypothetical protein
MPMRFFVRLFGVAIQAAIVCGVTFGAVEIIAWLGYEPSYTDAPRFYQAVGLFVGIPGLLVILHGVATLIVEYESEAARVEPTLLEPLNDSIPPLGDDGGFRLIEDIRRDRLPPG